MDTFLATIAITIFETEISNFFALKFSNTSYAKEPMIKKVILVNTVTVKLKLTVDGDLSQKSQGSCFG